MHQAHLGQYLYLTSLAGAFGIMVLRSGRYQALGQRQGQRSGCGGHNGGRVNVDRGNNSFNIIVRFLKQVDSNRTTPVPGIDVNTIDAD